MDENKDTSLEGKPSKKPSNSGKKRRPSHSRGRSYGDRSKKNKNKLSVTSKGRTKHLSSPVGNGNFVVFDIETTGGNPEKNGITEIFAIRYHDGKILETFESMVNPKVPIPPIVRRMTGITNRMVKDAPLIEEVMPSFIEFIGDDVLVSHNTIGDMKFLRYFSQQVSGEMISNYYLCTHLLVEKLAAEAPDKSLKGLASFFELPADDKLHRAKADSYLTLELFKKLKQRMLDHGIKTIIEGIRFQGDYESGMRLGWGVDQQTIRSLPQNPGVYYLKDFSGKVVFLSSAYNLAREVRKLQRFSSLPRQLLKSVLSSVGLSYQKTETALEASILEAQELSKHKIRFDPANWHQRAASFLYLKEESSDRIRVATGSLAADVIVALGPIRGGKEVGTFIENLAEACGKKLTKKGFELNLSETKQLTDYLGLGRGTGFLSLIRKLIPKLLQSSQVVQLEKKLQTIDKPAELRPLSSCSGLVAMQYDNQWQCFTVMSGLVLDQFEIEGDLAQGLSKDGKCLKIYKNLRRQVLDQSKQPPRALSHQQAMMINRVTWWASFGNRNHDIRLYSLDELASLGTSL